MRRAFIVSPRERFRSGLAQTFRRRMSSGCRRLRASTVRQQDSHHRRQNRARHLGKVFCRRTFRTSRKETRHCSLSLDIVHNYVRRKHQFKTPKRAGVFRSLFSTLVVSSIFKYLFLQRNVAAKLISTQTKPSIRDPRTTVRQRIHEIVRTRVRCGYRRVHIMLKREGPRLH